MNRIFRIKEIDGNNDFKDVTFTVGTLKQYVLIAAVNFHDNKLQGGFDSHAENYKGKIIAKLGNGDLTNIILFNLLTGEIIISEYSGKNKTKESIDKLSPITDSDYHLGIHPKYPKNRFFHPNGKIKISKYTFYDFVEEIGIKNSGSLMELCIFSHAYFDGPILVDSVQHVTDYTDPISKGVISVTNGFDINDYDMRRTDISEYYRNYPSNKTDFKSAFHIDGAVKIFGCSFPQDTNALYSKLRKDKNHLYTSTKKIPDDTKFIYPRRHFLYYPTDHSGRPIIDPLTYKQQEVDLVAQQLNPTLGKTYDVNKEIELTFLQIKQFLISQFTLVFAAKMAEFFDLKVIAALPATYSLFDKNYFRISPDTLNTVKMYEKHLDIVLGEYSYGIYEKADITRLKSI